MQPPEMRSPETTELDSGWQTPAVIVGSVAATAALGSLATFGGLPWYRSLEKPRWRPSDGAIGPVWTLLYTLLAGSVLAFRRSSAPEQRPSVYFVFGSNLALNLAWTVIFFRGHNPLAAGLESIALEGTCVALVWKIRPVSRTAALAQVPYVIWVAFATALTFSIWSRNR